MNWSLLGAFEEDAQHGFNYPLTVKRIVHPDFADLDHEARMELVDEFNEIFRFAYTQGEDPRTGKKKGYYKIPLMRDYNVDPNKIKISISRFAYEWTTAIIDNVGRMERIARAIPYHELLVTVRKHLKKEHGVDINETVIVGVDRGGRLPAIIMSQALNNPNLFFLKVDQGGEDLDIARLEQFAQEETFKGKHVLFVDSTVDSGRQIEVLRQYFDDSREWIAQLGHKSWSIVGSNEYGQHLYNHLNVNWGVNPDETFEDDPQLMGVDYAPDTHTRVVEIESATAQRIRQVILDVPAGYVFDTSDISEQIELHKQKLAQEELEATAYEEVEKELQRIMATREWRRALDKGTTVSLTDIPPNIPNGVPHKLHNLLIVGNGKQVDIPQEAALLIADTLGSYHSFFAGTPKGNPGLVLRTVLERAKNPEVRLYQPERMRDEVDHSFGGVPVVFVGPEKKDMRRKMVKDSQIALALGGNEGTFREILLALRFNRPTLVIKGWGPVANYLAKSKKFSSLSHLKMCDGIGEALQQIMEMTKV